MVTIVYNELTQYNIEVEDLTEEEVKEMSEKDIKSLIDDMVGRRVYDGEYGEIRENEHHRNEFEVLNEDEKSIKYFQENYD